MKILKYTVLQKNHLATFFDADDNELLYSKWFLEFGKTEAEIIDTTSEVQYQITKKFKFWQWKMSYNIIDKQSGNNFTLESSNKKRTTFDVFINDDTYQIEVHYKEKKSIYKNNIKIAEIARLSQTQESTILIDINANASLIFLFFTCLEMGEHNQKPLLKSQKTLVSNTEPWDKISG